MPLFSIHYLLNRLTQGTLTQEEQQQLTDLLQNNEHESLIKEELLKMLHNHPHASQQTDGQLAEGDWARVLGTVFAVDKTAGTLSDMPTNIPSATGSGSILVNFRAHFRKWSVAALLLLTLGGAAFYFLHRKQAPAIASHAAPATPATIKPGSDQAVLTLANGQQVVLKDAQQGVLSQQGNTRVIKLDNGKLAYDASQPGNSQSSILYNTITTPRGGQYQVTLPDGTKVWLNAESSLRFPTSFSGNEREVQLTGEAYFEVAPDKHQPFLVQAGKTRTLVMGTHFNIMAYGDEAAVRTTLLEGAVKMEQGKQNTILHPGEQGDFDVKGGTLTTKTVNTKAVVAWKDGYYYFDRTPVQSVMRQIARWYNVDIEYQGTIPQDQIVGKLPRTAYVSEVLHIMELIGIHFSIQGRKIIVLNN